MRYLSIVVLTLILGHQSLAGIFELGTNLSYRKSTVDDVNWEEKKEIGASISYYFWAQSAIELSYTARLSVKNIGTMSGTTITSQTELQTEELYYGIDFVLSLADMKASIRPYLKAGALYVHKKELQQDIVPPNSAVTAPWQDIWAPSAGAGVKIGLTQTMSLKLGLETWSLALMNGKTQYDYSGRAGLSWLF